MSRPCTAGLPEDGPAASLPWDLGGADTDIREEEAWMIESNALLMTF